MIDGNNFHRVVLFGDDAETAGSLLLLGMDSRDVEDLWGFLEKYEATTGGAQWQSPQ